MGLQFTLSSPSEEQEIRDFLLKTFNADPDLNSFRPEVLRWKYFASHPDWNGTRSYLLKNEDAIAAHASVWPIPLRGQSSEMKGIHLLDWAAIKTSPGAGLHILRKIAEMADVLIGIGGSSYTREILPKFGYKQAGEFYRYVYVARPWKQLRSTPQYNWKTPLRFLRNAGRGMKRIPAPPERWTAERVTRFEPSFDTILERSPTPLNLRSVRTTASLNYMLDSPAAEFSGFVVNDGKQLRGCFVLAKIGGQARIVDVQIDANHAHQQAISRLAARTAAQDPEICEVIVGTSRSDIGTAFEQIGFWRRRTEPIFFYDPRKKVDPAVRFELSFLDNDFSFIYNPKTPYIS